MRDPVFLTGATGFIGGHVLRALLAAGHPVRALVRPAADFAAPEGCSVVRGDVTESGGLVRDLDGCGALVHVAGAYSFAPGDRAHLRAVNVAGSAGLLEAARLAGVERAVVTSSSSTVGPARGGRLATEADWAAAEGHSAYHASKIEQERAVLAARLGAVLVLPTAPIGPGDHRPTPTGAMIVDFLRGRMVGTITSWPRLPGRRDRRGDGAGVASGGGLNLVAVEDVARAHVAALERGRPRERYLVGGENLELAEVWRRLAEMTGRPVPRLRIPYAVALGAGIADELRCRVAPSARPVVPLEGVRMARHRMWVDDSKARTELGHTPSSVTEALDRAVGWFRAHHLAA